MRTTGPALALAVAASACNCGRARPIWIGLRGDARVIAVPEDGSPAAIAAAAPALDAPVRALAPRLDGTVVALEDVDAGGPPAVLLARSGERLATFASVDGNGARLFDAQDPPWAVAIAQDGTAWVTGGPAPVRYGSDGKLVGRAASVGSPTRGIAALPDGRMIVSYGLMGIAVYRSDGTVASSFTASLGPANVYYGIDALAARGGTILVSVLRHGSFTEGVVVEAALGDASLVLLADPAASARFSWSASELAVDGDGVLVGPSLAPLAPVSCAIRLSSDLARNLGCVVTGAHSGVAVVR